MRGPLRLPEPGLPVALLLALLAGGCGVEPTLNPTSVTWYRDIGPIVRTRCSGCHRPGGIGPFSLHDYDDIGDLGSRMVEMVDSGEMPPWSAVDAPDCTPRHPWRDDPRLTSAERALLHTWVEHGQPAGMPALLPDVPSTTLDDPTVHVAPAQPFTASGDRDQFVCFLFDPQISHRMWLTASQVVPTLPAMVHHANVDLVAPGDAAAAIMQLGGIGVPSPNCGTPPGLPIQSWLPGNPALKLPNDVGIAVEQGTLVAIQVHYHPAGGGGDDATGVELRFTDAAPKWSYELGVYGNQAGPPRLLPDPDDPASGPEFVIPANRPDHVETMQLPNPAVLTRELRVLSVTPHMHLLGTHERATIAHSGGDTECLIDSTWNFDWQRSYTFDADYHDLPQFDAGSTVTVSCHWNNTLDNPNLGRLLHDSNHGAPFDVHLGLTTTDEMCLADFGVITPTVR